MVQSVEISSDKPFVMADFLHVLDLDGVLEVCSSEAEGVKSLYFMFEGSSTTLFVLDVGATGVSLGIDGLAAWDDYKRFPYILDTLSIYLTGSHLTFEGRTPYKRFDEDWIAESMGEEIACLKAWLSVHDRYYLSLPVVEGTYVSKDILHQLGVCLHSSTPRIYGYIHYLLAYEALPADSDMMGWGDAGSDVELPVPQHVSIGRVKSWMLDGSETWESYSREDVDLLLAIAEDFRAGRGKPLGVVLNDIGTLHQMGIGTPVNGAEAEYWFRMGYKTGDHWFSPTNLGDLYRKGCGLVAPSLAKAFDAYQLSDDPYAWYRIGQAWEEGWIPGQNDIQTAVRWYRKAADAGHHLAVDALKRLDIQNE